MTTTFKQKYPKHPMKLKVIERKLGREKALGQICERTIEIDPRQQAKEYLDTAIHEGLHPLLPHRKEEFILHAANTLTELLWKLGYRKVILK